MYNLRETIQFLDMLGLDVSDFDRSSSRDSTPKDSLVFAPMESPFTAQYGPDFGMGPMPHSDNGKALLILNTQLANLTNYNEGTDDYSSDSATTGILPIDGSLITGTIETPGDDDWFRLTITEAITLRIDLDGITLPNTALVLRDSRGASLDLGYIDEQQSQFLVYDFEPGTYFVSSDSYAWSSPGTYQLMASLYVDDFTADITTTGVLLTDGSATTGELNNFGDHDWFKMTITELTRLQIDLQSVKHLSDPFLILYDNDGNFITSDDDSGPGFDSRITYDLQPGDYYVSASAYDDDRIGTYELSAVIQDVVVTGTDNADQLFGLAGNDSLFGEAGNDSLVGRGGNDILEGGAGGDELDGGAGIDTASYEGSTNRVVINMATDSITSGHATGDSFISIENITGSQFADTITGDGGANVISGGNGFDVLSGFNGDDTLMGGAGNDFMTGGRGADIIDGGAGGADMARYVGSDAGVMIDLEAGTATGGHANGDTLIDVEFLFGSSHDDSLTGDANNNWLYGDGGNDTLDGGAGIDKLFGGAGADSFVFSAGDDFAFVTDWEDDVDSIDLSDYGYASVDDAMANMSQFGAHVRFFDGENTLLILNADLADMADDIVIADDVMI